MVKSLNILATASQTGSVNILVPIIHELKSRGHVINVYATGNETEASRFGKDISYTLVHPEGKEYNKLLKGNDAAIVGMAGYHTCDSYFMRTAVKQHIPVIAIQDVDAGYKERLGDNPKELPTVIALMDENCKETMKNDLDAAMFEEAIKRTFVIGWAAFDNYHKIKEEFTPENRRDLLKKLDINPNLSFHTHFTQNIHPATEYIQSRKLNYEEWLKKFEYEMKVTEKVLEIAEERNFHLVVKPHPGEKFHKNFTKELVEKYRFNYLDAASCDSKYLMLASHSVSAGKSTCLIDACLLDKNTGGIFPDLNEKDVFMFPPVKLNAIPYTFEWDSIKKTLEAVYHENFETRLDLAHQRKRFSVDGKASKRAADIIENLVL